MYYTILTSCLSPGRPRLPSGKLAKEPLINDIYTADPSAHVFEGKVYIYPSHDPDKSESVGGEGGDFNMRDYHVFSLESMDGPVVDHGQVLHVDDVPWAEKQMWAPDAAFKNNTYYFYFPAKDREGLFRIGVATGSSPSGPFKPEPEPIKGSYSVDPCVFIDDDGQAYMIFGGLLGGQLEKWSSSAGASSSGGKEAVSLGLGPRIAKMADSMLEFDGPVREILLLDEGGVPIGEGNHSRRYFEGPWMHKYQGKYYLSYSTGDTHLIVYAVGSSLAGPFQYQGLVLKPVIGWTTHHSIIEYKGKWYIFYHDASLSGGVDHKRCVKVAELFYNPDGTIRPVTPE